MVALTKRIYHPELILYHNPCSDGDASVFILQQWLMNISGSGPDNDGKFGHTQWASEVQFLPADYSKMGPDFEASLISLAAGKNVWLVDFSFKADMMTRVAPHCNYILVLDHHATAQDILLQYKVDKFRYEDLEKTIETAPTNVVAIFDMERSGLGLAHEFVNGDAPLSDLLAALERCDLGKGSLDDLQAQSAVRSFPSDLIGILYYHQGDEEGDSFLSEYDAIKRPFEKAFRDGVITNRQLTRITKDMAKSAEIRTIGSHRVFVVNAAFPIGPSLIGAALNSPEAAKVDYFLAWWANPNGKAQLSFRSNAPFDVSAIALTLGGGGHKQASGANPTLKEAMAFIYQLA